MEKIIVIGGGGHAKSVIGILKKIGRYAIVGYTDSENKGNILGIPYWGTDEKFLREIKSHGIRQVVLGVGQIDSQSRDLILWSNLEN